MIHGKCYRASPTRWLSLKATEKQLLIRLDVLKIFLFHGDLEKFDSTEWIINILHKPKFEIYQKKKKKMISTS